MSVNSAAYPHSLGPGTSAPYCTSDYTSQYDSSPSLSDALVPGSHSSVGQDPHRYHTQDSARPAMQHPEARSREEEEEEISRKREEAGRRGEEEEEISRRREEARRRREEERYRRREEARRRGEEEKEISRRREEARRRGEEEKEISRRREEAMRRQEEEEKISRRREEAMRRQEEEDRYRRRKEARRYRRRDLYSIGNAGDYDPTSDYYHAVAQSLDSRVSEDPIYHADPYEGCSTRRTRYGDYSSQRKSLCKGQQSDDDYQRHNADRHRREGRAQDRFGQRNQRTSKMNEFFLDGEEASARPATFNGIRGILITASRPFTPRMLDDLQKLSAEYTRSPCNSLSSAAEARAMDLGESWVHI